MLTSMTSAGNICSIFIRAPGTIPSDISLFIRDSSSVLMETTLDSSPAFNSDQRDHKALDGASRLVAALPRRYRSPMGAGVRMPQQNANRLDKLRRQDMLELARGHLRLFGSLPQDIGDQPLRQPVPPYNSLRHLLALDGEGDAPSIEIYGAARMRDRLRVFSNWRSWSCSRRACNVRSWNSSRCHSISRSSSFLSCSEVMFHCCCPEPFKRAVSPR